MRTTTFNQVINGETFNITVPMHRVETVINRVDRLINKKKFAAAVEALQPFVGAAPVAQTVKLDNVSQIIEEYRNLGRYVVITQLVQSGMSKASAYYRTRKAGL